MKGHYKSPKYLHLTPSELSKYLQQATFSPKNLLGPLKRSPNGEILPNLVALEPLQKGRRDTLDLLVKIADLVIPNLVKPLSGFFKT